MFQNIIFIGQGSLKLKINEKEYDIICNKRFHIPVRDRKYIPSLKYSALLKAGTKIEEIEFEYDKTLRRI